MCSDATNGEYEDIKTKSEAECPIEGDNTLSDSSFHALGNVLEMLIRLDQQGFFMNASDKSLASYCTPMCFSKMLEKVSTEQYSTWNSFVDDFESMCENAMKHNQKRSEVWNAASSLLRQGRRCLEQQSSKERTIVEYAKSTQNGVKGEKLSPKVKLEQNEGSLPESAVGWFVHVSKEERVSGKSFIKIENDERGEGGHTVSAGRAIASISELFSEKNASESSMVDILELSPGELARLEFDKQATDCSSSFGDTQVSLTDDEVDGRSCEVESELRNGNGAMVLSDDIPPSNRKKKTVNQEWKTYRQGIEWRCRWLELRVKELQALANKYNDILVTSKSTMKQESEQQESISARTSAIFSGYQHRALLRLLRRKEEEKADSKMHMSKHPVFSRYEKKQQRSQEELANDENNKDSYQILDFDDFHPDFDNGFGDDYLVEEDSVEQYLWHIEALQLHICSLKNQLTRGSTSHRITLGQIKDISYSGGVSEQVCLYDTNALTSSPSHLGARSLLGGFQAKGGKSLARKRSAEFDTDSLIMPDTVMANYIEPARHAFIETPHWRELGDAVVSARGASSEEDSDDGTYKKRKVELQLQETHEQDVPENNSESLASMKEQACAESTVNTMDGALKESVQNFSTSFGFVPRRKRRWRESKGKASVAKNIEPLLKASYEDSTDPCERGDLVEDEDNYKASSTG
ncbi:hypothetical protein L7F22_043283 [Adiantum nelumboides]|nr:hypothetical protein [Adiantum nelumboides]